MNKPQMWFEALVRRLVTGSWREAGPWKVLFTKPMQATERCRCREWGQDERGKYQIALCADCIRKRIAASKLPEQNG